jgi:hypothetical protein
MSTTPWTRRVQERQRSMHATQHRSDGDDLEQSKNVLVGSSKEGERMIIVGDVHGCREELELLLKECSYNPDKDRCAAYFFLGRTKILRVWFFFFSMFLDALSF